MYVAVLQCNWKWPLPGYSTDITESGSVFIKRRKWGWFFFLLVCFLTLSINVDFQASPRVWCDLFGVINTGGSMSDVSYPWWSSTLTRVNSQQLYAHSTHSVHYSILHIFMFPTSDPCCSTNDWTQGYLWVACCLHGAVLMLPPVGWALPSPRRLAAEIC